MEYRHIKNKTVLVLANYDVGLYKFRKALLHELITLGNTVYISLPDGEHISALAELGCKFIETVLDRRGMNPIRDIGLYRKYLKILQDIRPDLVITYTIKPNIYGGFACRVKKIPYAANITGLGSAIEGGGVLRKLIFAMYRTALKRAKVVFFENEGNLRVLLDAGIVKKDQTCLLNGAGIDTDEYPLLPYPTDSTVRFLFVGRIMKEKGVDELFYAAQRLKNEFGDGVVIDIVGMFEESYQTMIEDLQTDGAIVFHGYQRDVGRFYEKAHCVVLPSYHEGMSNVLLEAASSGRAVITSDIYGCREAVEDGVSGFLCKPKDADALYAAMRKFFAELSQEDKKQFGIAGRHRIEVMFTKTKVVNKTLERLSDGE